MTSTCATQPTWIDASRAGRVGLEHGMREWVHAQFNGSAEVLYWLTPKAAHTLIGRLLRKPPWRVLQHGDGHDGTDGSPWMGVYPNRSVTMRAVETDLQNILRRRPLEFTFVREPLGHLISSAGQLHWCLRKSQCHGQDRLIDNYDGPPGAKYIDEMRSEWNRSCTQELRQGSTPSGPDRVLELMTMAAGNKKLPCNKTPFQCQPWNESRYPPRTSGNTGWPMQKGCTRATCLTGYSYELVNRCARHMWPQSSGYGFDPARGPTRLHFVGRVEQFQHDWARLLTRLGDREHTAFNRLKIRHVNYRPIVHELAPSSPGRRRLERNPLVARWLAADRACGFGAPS